MPKTLHKNKILSLLFLIMPLALLAKNSILYKINLAITGILGGYLLIAILVALLIIIWILIRHIRKSTDFFVDSWKNEQRKSSGKNKAIGTVLLLLTNFGGYKAFSQTDSLQTVSNSGSIAGLPNFLFYLVISLIVLEIVVILFLVSQARLLINRKKDLENKV